jgi:predicted DNA-binding transcriptional regulator YafY
MNQINRLKQIYDLLIKKSHSYSDLILYFEKEKHTVGIRQLQRDLRELPLVVKNDEKLIKFRNTENKIHFKILKGKVKSSKKKIEIENKIENSNFFNLLNRNSTEINLTILHEAINESKNILIKQLKNDVTGDNYKFNQKNIELIPIKIIKHRGSIYLGCYNVKEEKNQIYDILQFIKIEKKERKSFLKLDDIYTNFNTEISNRFGVSKNINEETYNIIIEFSNITGNFIKQHFWHESQKFTKRKNTIIMELNCGINRELIGWLFYWMYNCKIIAPDILKEYYIKSHQEIAKLYKDDQAFVYKNIFIKNE